MRDEYAGDSVFHAAFIDNSLNVFGDVYDVVESFGFERKIVENKYLISNQCPKQPNV